jgi:hypothetical protein
MNAIAKAKIDSIQHRTDVLKKVLSHFDKLENANDLKMLVAAADFAYMDDLLFEEFEIWMEEKNDKALLFQIEHFFKRKDRAPLPNKLKDITGKSNLIEQIKQDSENDAATTFATKLNSLVLKKGLKTNEEIGEFLGEMTAEQVRVLLSGKHKPQRKTLLRVAEAFRVPVEFFLED